MASRKPPTKAQMKRQVADWNAKYTEKVQVRFWPGTREGEGQLGWTQTAATILGGHTAGVYIGGAGFVALSHVEVIDDGKAGA
ncbi:MAG TPA: hypothetical protein VM869_19430 [Enhygromyxa sp.]|nr:hypothetical protein [Enhygromyxa sp.]